MEEDDREEKAEEPATQTVEDEDREEKAEEPVVHLMSRTRRIIPCYFTASLHKLAAVICGSSTGSTKTNMLLYTNENCCI